MMTLIDRMNVTGNNIAGDTCRLPRPLRFPRCKLRDYLRVGARIVIMSLMGVHKFAFCIDLRWRVNYILSRLEKVKYGIQTS